MNPAPSKLVIVGGGPAGMVAGLLFARAGVETIVLEKHADFLRDFRGDTVHPSTLRIFSELGVLDGLLARPHDKVRTLGAWIGARHVEIADFSRLDPRWAFIAMMPQWEFLDFVADEARRYPCFTLRMNCDARDVVMDGGRVAGVRVATPEGNQSMGANLVIAADGRRSVLRGAAALPLEDLGAPIDVLWFRLPKARTPDNRTTGYFGAGQLVVSIDRGDYWQCAYVIAKGGTEAVRAAGLDAFKARIAAAAPELGEAVAALANWDEVKLLSVALDRLARWHRPGLLAIGDAAHAMSPVGGVGINLAVQDAVAAANILAAPMARGERVDARLAKVRARRLPAVRIVQGMQKLAHDRVIARALGGTLVGERLPLPLRLLNSSRLLRAVPAAAIGLGFRPEHVRSPVALPRFAQRDLGE